MPEPITVAKAVHTGWKLRKPIALAIAFLGALVLVPITFLAFAATALAGAQTQCGPTAQTPTNPASTADPQTPAVTPLVAFTGEPVETNRPPAEVCETLAGFPGGVNGPGAGLIDSSSIAAPDPLARDAIAYAYAQIGKPYVDEGLAQPPDSWDCSKLTAAAWGSVGVRLVPYSYTQYEQVQLIPRDAVEPGDLVFWFKNEAHHVAIVDTVGHVPGLPTRITFVEAANPERGVVRSELAGDWYTTHLSGFGRVIRTT
jgi:cell wall-associated NlpC family hydrolase